MSNSIYLRRCLDLAKLGTGNVSPNPLVGACLVYDDRIIGEGYHQRIGEAHAEVNAFNAVKDHDRPLIPSSTLYVSLEPCTTQGKTPPCADRIISEGVPKVVIGSPDPNPKVNGKGIKFLNDNGVEVILNPDPSKFIELNRAFWINQTLKRTYITGKIAKSKDGFIGKRGERIWLSNSLSTIESHRMRAMNEAIIVGVNTVINDDPELTTRLVEGDNPVRIVPDLQNKIPLDAKIFNKSAETWYFTPARRLGVPDHVRQFIWEEEYIHPKTFCALLFEHGIGRAVLEGGSALMRSFHYDHCLDEFLEILTPRVIDDGVAAPLISMSHQRTEHFLDDIHNRYYSNEILKLLGHIS